MFKIKGKTGKTVNNDTKNFETVVPLRHLNNFCRPFEKSLINCEINLDLSRSKSGL